MVDTARPNRVMLIPTLTAEETTAPPASPWYLAARRAWVQVLPALPILLDVLIGLYQSGEVQVPSKWAALVSTLIVIYASVQKGLKEQRRQDAAQALTRTGLPMGEPLDSSALAEALLTEKTLLEAQTQAPVAR